MSYLVSATTAEKIKRLIRERDDGIGTTTGGGAHTGASKNLQFVRCGDVAEENVYEGIVQVYDPEAGAWIDLGAVYLYEANDSRLTPDVRYFSVQNGEYTPSEEGSETLPLFLTGIGLDDGSSTSLQGSSNQVEVVTDVDCRSGGLHVETKHLSGYVTIGGRQYPVTLTLSEGGSN